MVKENKPKAESKNPEYVKAEQVETSGAGKVELTPEEKKKIYKESLIRTAIATIFGIACGLILFTQYSDSAQVKTPSWIMIFLVLIVVTYYIQRRGLYPLLKLDVSKLDWKSWFGIEFLVIAYSLVTWTILLNIL